MEKKYDAVEEMRAIRAKLRKEHEKDPALRQARLQAIRRDYPFLETIENTH